MNNVLGVEVSKSICQLRKDIPRLVLRHASTGLDVVRQLSTFTEVHHQVQAPGGRSFRINDIMQLYNFLMVEHLERLHLTCHERHGGVKLPCQLQSVEVDHLHCILIGSADASVHHRGGTLAQALLKYVGTVCRSKSHQVLTSGGVRWRMCLLHSIHTAASFEPFALAGVQIQEVCKVSPILRNLFKVGCTLFIAPLQYLFQTMAQLHRLKPLF
mmetsp:Transcript_33730/g.78833  ORF Transcript_33730/g.78833 Transcript_33730/m.78833 type:complete len:214 (+) Transcript_33730:1746-2387(+)